MSILITGVAGFIGSRLAEVLVRNGEVVFGLDNLSLGCIKNIASLKGVKKFSFSNVDLSDLTALRCAVERHHSISPITEVWHLAANSNIPAGIDNASIDLKNTFITTFNTLQVMKEFGIKTILFASSSAIYGDLGGDPLKEDAGPLFPISNYGAMKLASEAVISSFTENCLNNAYIFRFPNVIGVPATHGVILDFIRKLKKDKDNLAVLGDGTQMKSYLHVEDLIDGMLFIRNNSFEKINFYNIGSDDDGVTVRDIALAVVKKVSPDACISYGVGNRGWVGDVPIFKYSVEKLSTLGWHPKMGSKAALDLAVSEIVKQELNL